MSKSVFYIVEILVFVESQKIPLDQLQDEIINNSSYEELSSLKEALDIVLFALDIRKYCDFIRPNTQLNYERKEYRKAIKRTYKKVEKLLEEKKNELPPLVKYLLDEFDGVLE